MAALGFQQDVDTRHKAGHDGSQDMTPLKMGAIGSPADAWISQNSLEEEIFQCFGEFHKIAYWICRLR
jgi:hypothetical protein